MKARTQGARRDRSSVLVWFDAEFTTLDLERARLLQVAMIVTDSELRRLGPPDNDVCLTIRLPPRVPVSRWVREQLPGLVTAARSAEAVTEAQADRHLVRALRRAVGSIPAAVERRPVLAGNSVHTDWWLIRRFLPRFEACLHYRRLDVSTLKFEWRRLCPRLDFDKADTADLRRWYPGPWTAVGGRHDALFDLHASIAELAFYRRHLLRRSVRPPAAWRNRP
ncbi:MAG: exonuclease domain-containing protein [Kiritimatiellae bacterium]|nr:exonuclease domain-containing protein [Kiritimatiellia bacterium]